MEKEVETVNAVDRKKYAKVHSIETFGTVDGPGIRFVIFMQGCHLRCKYCHNRDTWDKHGGSIVKIEEIYNKILNYKTYIEHNGGVTVTGGEPLLQAESIIELFKKLKKQGIHTCIDTSGMVLLTDTIKELINLTDLFMVDIKHIDPEKCKQLVGLDNKKELEFVKYLSDIGKEIWIRQVLIPGVTDDEQDLKKLGEFIKSLKTVSNVEILPYHSLGKYKWDELGFKYELEGVPSATSEDVKRAKAILNLKEK